MADDLEERKEETWQMGEVRSSGAVDTDEEGGTSDTPDKDDNSDGPVTEDTSDPADRAVGETVREMAIDADEKSFAVRDLHNVNVYLYEEIYREMVATFKELDTEYYREHGDELSKNKEFFNAVFRAGLESPQLREELSLDEDK